MRNNSLRFRLTRSEVERLAETKEIEEAIDFGASPDQRFIYRLEIRDGGDLAAELSNNRVIISIPSDTVNEWSGSDLIGIDSELPVENGKTLRIAIEKDFACLTARPGEDDSDSFPNPARGAVC